MTSPSAVKDAVKDDVRALEESVKEFKSELSSGDPDALLDATNKIKQATERVESKVRQQSGR